MERIVRVLYWAARLIAAIVMLQTLYFKFSGAPESIYIFTTAGIEPWGRILVGLMELAAAILLLINATAWLGAGLALGLMTGAIFLHLTKLGIEVQGDNGYLFFLALIVASCSIIVLLINRDKIIGLLRMVRTLPVRKRKYPAS